MKAARNAHTIALSLRQRTKETTATADQVGNVREQRREKNADSSIWEDTLVVAEMNLGFVTERLSTLRETIAAQESIVGANEVKFIGLKEENNKRSKALKSELDKIDALIDFLGHPDFLHRR